jgi:predicted DNA-binding ribbon-helix-helix protein
MPWKVEHGGGFMAKKEEKAYAERVCTLSLLKKDWDCLDAMSEAEELSVADLIRMSIEDFLYCEK